MNFSLCIFQLFALIQFLFISFAYFNIIFSYKFVRTLFILKVLDHFLLHIADIFLLCGLPFTYMYFRLQTYIYMYMYIFSYIYQYCFFCFVFQKTFQSQSQIYFPSFLFGPKLLGLFWEFFPIPFFCLFFLRLKLHYICPGLSYVRSPISFFSYFFILFFCILGSDSIWTSH